VGVPNLELAALCTRRPERLAAMAAKFDVSQTYRDYHDLLADPEIDAVSIVTMWDQHTEPAGGATATLETVWCMPERTPFDIDERMTIIGTEGFLHIQDTFPNLGIVSPDGFRSPDTTYWPEFDGVRGGALREEFAYFANCALAGTQPLIGRPADVMEALAATLAADEQDGDVLRAGTAGVREQLSEMSLERLTVWKGVIGAWRS
jgi:predicted dehydrogenase